MIDRLLRPCRPIILLVCTGAMVACSAGTNAVDQSSGIQYRYNGATKSGTLIQPDKRKFAGDVKGPLVGGGDYRLSADRGHVVLLNFFASWCPPCQIEAPQLDSYWREQPTDGLRVVGLDVRETTKSAATSWLEAKRITFPVVYDPNAKTALEIGDIPIVGIPDSVLIDKQGRVAAVYVGPVLSKDLEPVVSELRRES